MLVSETVELEMVLVHARVIIGLRLLCILFRVHCVTRLSRVVIFFLFVSLIVSKWSDLETGCLRYVSLQLNGISWIRVLVLFKVIVVL